MTVATSRQRSCKAVQALQAQAALKIINWWRRHRVAYLDQNFGGYLVLGETTWAEIPFCYRFQSSGWWDIRFLSKHFAQQLNHNQLDTPNPIFPNNPFNRQPFSPEEMNKFFNRVEALGVTLNVALSKFKEAPFRYWYRSIQNKPETTNKKICEWLSKNLRYQIINQSNSESSFIGRWVPRNQPLSVFETTYRNWITTPIYVTDPSGSIVFNPQRDFNWMKLRQLDKESWCLHKDTY